MRTRYMQTQKNSKTHLGTRFAGGSRPRESPLIVGSYMRSDAAKHMLLSSQFSGATKMQSTESQFVSTCLSAMRANAERRNATPRIGQKAYRTSESKSSSS